MKAFLAGFVLATINAIVAIFFIKKSLRKKKHRDFSDLFFKSLGIRSVFVLLLFWLVIEITDVDIVIFSITFVASYFLYILLEIVLINNYLLKKQGN